MINSSNDSELSSLREYVCALERQNTAKLAQQQTLYRQLQSLRGELTHMEKYYEQNKALRAQMQQINNSLQRIIIHSSTLQQNNRELIHHNQLLEARMHQYNQRIIHLETIQERTHDQLQQQQQQKNQIQNNREQILQMLKQKQEQNHALRCRLQQLQKPQIDPNLQQLAQNYQKIELIVLEKEQAIRQLQSYITQLEHQCQTLNDQYLKIQAYARQLEQQAQAPQNTHHGQYSQLSQLTSHISKMELIRQNNKAIEKIAQLSSQNHFKHNHAYSECQSSNSPNKLQMRIQALKTQNQNLLRSLAL